jgi:hypothetical protein
MRQETNNEIDLLLRRLGRRQETSASSDHLDADELNSYAENVLPPPARARYTEHLAECARCRDLVVQLSSSAGVVVAHETTTIAEPSALRKLLANLFSPMVLRYAVPALGLVVVVAIGLMVSRNEGTSNSPVAEVRDQKPAQASVPASQPEQSTLDQSSRGAIDTTKSVNKSEARGDIASGTGAAAPPPPNAGPVVNSVAAEVRDADTAKKTVEQEQAKAKEEAPPAPKASPVTDGLRKLEPEAQKQAASVAVANAPTEEKTNQQGRFGDLAAASPGATTARKRGDSSAAGRAARREDDAEKDKNDEDTRSVAGRRFRKEDNVWTDTAYSSQNLIRLKRGSESYRALVADEPAIKQIADQLDGEVIVVWKGHAYRIQ